MVVVGSLYVVYLLDYPLLFFGRKICPSFYATVYARDTNGTSIARDMPLKDTVTFNFLRNRTYEKDFWVANDGWWDLHDIFVELVDVPQGLMVDRLKLPIFDGSVGGGSGNSLRLTTPPVSGDYLIKLRISSRELVRSYSLRIIVT